MKNQIRNEIQQADKRTQRRMFRRIKHRYFAVNRIHRVYDGETISIVSESGAPILDDEFAMLETFIDKDCEVILKSRPFRQSRKFNEPEDDINVEKGDGIVPILKEEFEGVEISGKAWDLSKSLNMFSRRIMAIVNDCPVGRFSIHAGGAGKFVWIQYYDADNPLVDGGIASGSLEDTPIHHDGRYFDDINYSKIAFAMIPVEDF